MRTLAMLLGSQRKDRLRNWTQRNLTAPTNSSDSIISESEHG